MEIKICEACFTDTQLNVSLGDTIKITSIEECEFYYTTSERNARKMIGRREHENDK